MLETYIEMRIAASCCLRMTVHSDAGTCSPLCIAAVIGGKAAEILATPRFILLFEGSISVLQIPFHVDFVDFVIASVREIARCCFVVFALKCLLIELTVLSVAGKAVSIPYAVALPFQCVALCVPAVPFADVAYALLTRFVCGRCGGYRRKFVVTDEFEGLNLLRRTSKLLSF